LFKATALAHGVLPRGGGGAKLPRAIRIGPTKGRSSIWSFLRVYLPYHTGVYLVYFRSSSILILGVYLFSFCFFVFHFSRPRNRNMPKRMAFTFSAGHPKKNL